MGKGNPMKHRINAHWFNGITSPIMGPNGTKAEGDNKDQTEAALHANDIGNWITTAADVDGLKTAISNLDYDAIRYGNTDHPQVFLTAKKAFSLDHNPGAQQILILITDGGTKSGEKCGKFLPADAAVYAITGNCTANQSHPCWRADEKQSCRRDTCICGLYYSHFFKQGGYQLIVVGVENKNHGEMLDAQMRFMASLGGLYFAKEFVDMHALIGDIESDICKQ